MASRLPLKHDPVRRMTELVLSQRFPAEFWPDSELAQFAGNDNLGWWIGTSARPRHPSGGTGNG